MQRERHLNIDHLREKIENEVTSIDVWIYEINDVVRHKLNSLTLNSLLDILDKLEHVAHTVQSLNANISDTSRVTCVETGDR